MMNQAPGLLNSDAEDFRALERGAQKLNLIKGKDIEPKIYGGLENGLGTDQYLIEEVPLDRGQDTIASYYPEVRAKKLKGMYARSHPLAGLDCASFGRPTEGVEKPGFPKK